LNKQQLEAVNNINGPCLLLSVPGGGKTTVIVSRIANMILNHNINPDRILTLTFSRASAFDMKHRFNKVFGDDIGHNVEFSTIHSFCYSVIRYYVKKEGKPFPQVIEGTDSMQSKTQILKQIYLEVNKEYISEDTLDELSSSISYVKNMLFEAERIEHFKTTIDNFATIYKVYEKHKRDTHSIDYDDMLTGTYILFRRNVEILSVFRNKYDYINVDESQDTSFAQHKLIELLTYPKNNIFMVGDEDQSIYGFRAAFPEALLNFKQTYPDARVLLMERNYRSTPNIVKAANTFIKQNKERYDKNMFTERNEGAPIGFIHLKDKEDQYTHIINALAKINNYAECAVLYRNNISAIALVDYLDSRNIPFYVKDSNIHFFKHWLVTDILSFIRLSMNAKDVESFEKIYYKTDSYISKEMLEHVVVVLDSHKSIFDALRSYPNISVPVKQNLNNLHKQLKKLSSMHPSLAVEYIENKIDYKKFIRRMCKEKGYSPESLNQILDALKTIVSTVNTFDELFNRLSYLQEVIQKSSNNRYKDAIVLSTIHSSKGLEFDNVFLIDLVEGQFPSSVSIGEFEGGSAELMEEEVRLFYVGVTRARNHLEIITFDNSNDRKIPVSRFVKQLRIAGNNVQREGIYKLGLNAQVEHSKFGIGVITAIDEKKDTIKINFKKSGTKTLAVKTCIDGGLLKFL
jgi:DNA helicase-2/ATP-dependent DNA helicase PcrA